MNERSSASGEEEINAQASVLMKKGIALLNGGAPDVLPRAVGFFAEVIALRKTLPLAENPRFRYGLAAGWINRGDALARLGAAENLTLAIASYAEAIDLLKEVPPDDDGLFVQRLAIAWINRGNALEKQKQEPAHAEAMQCFKTAIQLLSYSLQSSGPRHNLILASAWINLGKGGLRSGQSKWIQKSRAAAETALSLLAETDFADRAAAEAALKARHLLCQSLAVTMETAAPDSSLAAESMSLLTDTAEDALKLAQHWEKAGETSCRPLAAQFFHLGALAYEKHQPQFLAEFLLDHLDPRRGTCFMPICEEWLTIAKQSLRRARGKLRTGGFERIATPEGIQQLELLKELLAAEARLQAT